MDIDLAAVEVRNNEAAHRYEAVVEGQTAVITYQQTGNRIMFVHTGVPEPLEGHGIAARMARVALDDARARNLVVIPRCPYVASYIRRHQEYLDLVPPEERARVLSPKSGG